MVAFASDDSGIVSINSARGSNESGRPPLWNSIESDFIDESVQKNIESERMKGNRSRVTMGVTKSTPDDERVDPNFDARNHFCISSKSTTFLNPNVPPVEVVQTKRRICKFHKTNGQCPDKSNCRFAHGPWDLYCPVEYFKTRYCPTKGCFSLSCRDAHSYHEKLLVQHWMDDGEFELYDGTVRNADFFRLLYSLELTDGCHYSSIIDDLKHHYDLYSKRPPLKNPKGEKLAGPSAKDPKAYLTRGLRCDHCRIRSSEFASVANKDRLHHNDNRKIRNRGSKPKPSVGAKPTMSSLSKGNQPPSVRNEAYIYYSKLEKPSSTCSMPLKRLIAPSADRSNPGFVDNRLPQHESFHYSCYWNWDYCNQDLVNRHSYVYQPAAPNLPSMTFQFPFSTDKVRPPYQYPSYPLDATQINYHMMNNSQSNRYGNSSTYPKRY